ncbi:MAG: acetyl-CoA carboxylase biotin carboxylase subunit [Bacteroidetes bacterium TMED39]|nr:MAG: acetyl-CoA carboxylase biotin carboxylase subunit [Bacteroidetes bacterium TMED39]
MFKKILIANRGEIALRVIRTCKEMGIKTVAVYSEADQNSLPVKIADEAVKIGPAKSTDSYLNYQSILAAAEITNADAIHPGYGFLSENEKFSELCQDHGIKFIGASPEMIHAMGDKSNAKDTMKKARVPTIPGSDGLLKNIEEGLQIAKKIKYPVILKATAGGGGKGMRIVNSDSEFKDAWEKATIEAKAAFGNDGMYLEKFIEEPRHVEIQIAGDQYGNICHLSERDCSIQRRHQKIIEEVPSPFIDEKIRAKMGEAAIQAGKAINYEGLGTVEFLVDKNKDFYFMEMNTRIQVEHPITEEVIGHDLVMEQVKIAAGIPISGHNYHPNAFAMECRINAEDPFNNFRPSPGIIETLHKPGGYGVRIDSHIYSGYTIPPYYDSMIAKVIVKANSREEVIKKMERALSEFVIEGIKTTTPLLLKILKDPDFVAGNFTTKFMDTFEY